MSRGTLAAIATTLLGDKARKLVLVDKASQKAERRQNKRNPETILRKRAKKRAKYIAKLVEEGASSSLVVVGVVLQWCKNYVFGWTLHERGSTWNCKKAASESTDTEVCYLSC